MSMRIDLNDAHYIARGRSAEIIAAWAEKATEYRRAWAALAKGVGATRVATGFGGRLIGFGFDAEPDRTVWRPVKSWWVPKVSTKAGKAMKARMDAIEQPPSVLRELGLPAEGEFILDNRWYTADLHLVGIDGEEVWLITLPFGAHPDHADKYEAPPDAERITFARFAELVSTKAVAR